MLLLKKKTPDNFQNISRTTAWHKDVAEKRNYNETKTLKFIINVHRRPMFSYED